MPEISGLYIGYFSYTYMHAECQLDRAILSSHGIWPDIYIKYSIQPVPDTG